MVEIRYDLGGDTDRGSRETMTSYPKPDGSKVTRHKPRFDWTDLPASHSIVAPKLPTWRTWDRRTYRWWRDLWSKPQAVMWPPDGSSLHVLAALVDDLIVARADAVKVSAEIRQHEDRHGLTPKAMMQLRWRFAPSDIASQPTSSARPSPKRPGSPGTSSSMRSRLSVVPEPSGVIRYECSTCGALTAGRKPRGGDGSLMYPRRHKIDGESCPGSELEATTVLV
jgi:hypothetical protein